MGTAAQALSFLEETTTPEWDVESWDDDDQLKIVLSKKLSLEIALPIFFRTHLTRCDRELMEKNCDSICGLS